MNNLEIQRKKLRLPGYDYRNTGNYFITFCTQERKHLFGKVSYGQMLLNPAGEMLYQVMTDIPISYSNILIDTFIIMPDHIHAIMGVFGGNKNGHKFFLSSVIKNIKTLTTKRYINGVHKHGWDGFNKRLWQRNYYENIIRNDKHLSIVRRYILNNPQKWKGT